MSMPAATWVGRAVLAAAALGAELPHAVEARPKVDAPKLTRPMTAAAMRPTFRFGLRLAGVVAETLRVAREPTDDTFGPFLSSVPSARLSEWVGRAGYRLEEPFSAGSHTYAAFLAF